MKNPALSLLFNLMVIALLEGCHTLSDNKSECDSLQIHFLTTAGEMADRYLITPDNRLVFTFNDSDQYSLKIYNDGNTGKLMLGNKNVFNPYLLSGEISGLQDFDGDEKFIPLDDKLNEYTAGRAVKSMFSLDGGKRLIIELKNENILLLFDAEEKQIKTILKDFRKVNGISSSADGSQFIISFDNKLLINDSGSYINRNLANQLEGEKLNPFIAGDRIYFVNNSLSEYLSVYSVSISDTSVNFPVEVLATENDIRMPKIKDGFLYFVEVSRSEYLLRRINLATNETELITLEGVVYNYDFYTDSLISMVYSDLKTPKSLVLYNINSGKAVNITGYATKHNITSEYLINGKTSSSAWFLSDTTENMKGIILFIHPGINSDFSPRWDNIIMNLCANGYSVLAPNSPMSCGYGKSFMNLSVNDAIEDLKMWKSFISEHYKDKPVYCMSASSGNILMERLLEENSSGIAAAVSLFGVPGNNLTQIMPVPVIYILGENDPVVDFNKRYSTLHEEQKSHSTISIISYSDEGHWFRKKKNLQDAVSEIINYFCFYSD